MAIPKKKVDEAGLDAFIQGAAATKADNSRKNPITKKKVKFMLELPDEDFRTKINIEAMERKDQYKNVSEYICAILEQRHKLKL